MAAMLGFKLTSVGYAYFPRNLTKLEQNLLKSVFDNADADKKGYLTREDLKMAMIDLMGYKPSKYEADQILEKLGNKTFDGNITLNLGQFIEAMTPKLVSRDEDDEIRQTFLAFDTQCKGFLTVEDLTKAFDQFAPHMRHHRIESSFRELDRDGDGRVSYKDFDFMMKFDPLS